MESESEKVEDKAIVETETSSSVNVTKPEFCDLKPEIGPCNWKWTRYFYNASIDDCTPFTYGGCDGNENNFHNLLACKVICQEPNKTEDDLIFRIILGAKNQTQTVLKKSCGGYILHGIRPSNYAKSLKMHFFFKLGYSFFG